MTVLEGLAISPVLRFAIAGGLYFVLRTIVRSGHLPEPPKHGEKPVWWLRALPVTIVLAGVLFYVLA